MGFFNKPETTPSLAPAGENLPLARSRIEAILTEQGWNFGVDGDGDVGGQWDDNVFYFFLMGDASEVLQVRGRWKHTFPASRGAEFALMLNDLNRDRIWPKLYFRIENGRDSDDASEPTLGVYSEVSTDLEHGVSDAQLGQLVKCGLFTGLRAFENIAERLGITEE
jgi:Putative bacterial sensory transduction regulator